MIDYVVQHECELHEFAENYIEDFISVTDPCEVTE